MDKLICRIANEWVGRSSIVSGLGRLRRRGMTAYGGRGIAADAKIVGIDPVRRISLRMAFVPYGAPELEPLAPKLENARLFPKTAGARALDGGYFKSL
jgi:hypothetical protein